MNITQMKIDVYRETLARRPFLEISIAHNRGDVNRFARSKTYHAKGVYVIRNLLRYGINPKERYTLRVMPYACGDYILAHERLHTNPSDWIEKSKFFDLLFCCVHPTISNLKKFSVNSCVFFDEQGETQRNTSLREHKNT